MKKIIATAMALMLVMALSVTAFADYSMTATSGQDFDGKVLADGVELTGDWYTDKLSTNWVNSTEFDAIMAALQEDGAIVTLTYTGGEITAIGFQSSIGEIRATDLTVTTEGDVTTATVPAASLISDPFVLDGYEWCNLTLQASAGTVLTGFTISTGASEPEASEPEASEPETPAADTESDAEQTSSDDTAVPETGLVLAVVPAVIALAAAALFKKR